MRFSKALEIAFNASSQWILFGKGSMILKSGVRQYADAANYIQDNVIYHIPAVVNCFQTFN